MCTIHHFKNASFVAENPNTLFGLKGFETLEQFIASLKSPRKINILFPGSIVNVRIMNCL